MLRDTLRFYRQAPADHATLDPVQTTLGEYLSQHGFGRAFREDHLLPMAAAIWSAPARALLDYPAAAFIKFHHNHGLLRVRDRPQWRTVVGGSRTYVRRLAEPFADRILLDTGVASVARATTASPFGTQSGREHVFDHVVLATHADQALSLLADADAQERALLGAFRYNRNTAVLHTDAGLMPARRKAWASWNYIGRRDDRRAPVSVTYWMNRLQALTGAPDLFVTLNPPRPPRRGNGIA